MVLKGVKWVYNAKIRSYGLEKSQLGIQCKNQVIWSWKESIGYTVIKLGQMVLKGVNWVNNTKFRSYGFEMDQLGTICKTIIFKVSFEAKWYFSLKISYFSIFLHFHEKCIFLHFKENACHWKLHFQENACRNCKFSDIGLASSKGLFFERPKKWQVIFSITKPNFRKSSTTKTCPSYPPLSSHEGTNICTTIGRIMASQHISISNASFQNECKSPPPPPLCTL